MRDDVRVDDVLVLFANGRKAAEWIETVNPPCEVFWFQHRAQLSPAHKAEAAEDAAQFILSNMKNSKGGLLHRYRKGSAGIEAHLDDYAFLIAALIELYQSTFEASYLKEAIELNKTMLEHFWDAESGGLFLTGKDAEKLLIRPKEIYDGAIPLGIQ